MNAEVLESVIATHLPAAARGDTAAYGRIVANCQGMVTSIALAIVRDVPASEDIAQDAFLSAWQNLRKLGNPQSFLPWLRQITRNLARDHLRAQKYRANPEGDVEALIAAVADPTPGPQETLAESQEARIAADVIDALPEDTRETLLLYYREGQSSKQVAVLLGVQDAAVRKRLSRARSLVRDELLARLGEFARDSAPTAAFTATVLAATTLASPPAAAATVLLTGGAFAGKGLLKVLVGGLGSIGIGVLGGLSGIWWGLRRYLRAPFDALERRQLLRYGFVMSLLVIGFTVALVLSTHWSGWQAPVLATALYLIGVIGMATGWMPRILQRRHAQEMANDPVAARAARSKERRNAWIGCTLGLACGIGALVFGLIATGRL
ncbi:RNA polymerase sigma factor [Arenimonas sp.]|uniref:RNA polymerase sigma factor n=1 Tax=Arenimonas sp. TaxID=1872635 RepID=UPI0039E5AD6C